MIELYYSVMNAIFGPLLALGPALAELIIALFLSFSGSLFYRYAADYAKLRYIGKRLQELKKKKPTEETYDEIVSLMKQRFKLIMKPMLLNTGLILLFIPWMAHAFPGAVVSFGGIELNWILWYIVISVPATLIFRRIMGL